MSETTQREVNQTVSLSIEMIHAGKLPKTLTLHTAHGGGSSMVIGDAVLKFEGGVHTEKTSELISILADAWIKDKYKQGVYWLEDRETFMSTPIENLDLTEKPITIRYWLTPEERDQYVAKDKNYLYFMGALRPMEQVRLALAFAVEAGFVFDTAAQLTQGNVKPSVNQGSLSGAQN